MSHLPVRTKLMTSKPKPRSVSFLLTPLASVRVTVHVTLRWVKALLLEPRARRLTK